MAVTIEYAREMLSLWRDAEKALASGQAKAYRIGSREFTAIDLTEIASRIKYWENQVDMLEGTARKTRVVRVVPRDL